jgi:hypothetical protein
MSNIPATLSLHPAEQIQLKYTLHHFSLAGGPKGACGAHRTGKPSWFDSGSRIERCKS